MAAVHVRPQRNQRGYLPTLDGWRAIAIFGVLFNHDAIHSFAGMSTSGLNRDGHYGVDIFFAISGILICSRLLEEEALHGSISLRNFYVRRAFRILPPAIAYLVVVGLLGFLGVIVVYPRELMASLIFFRNYPGLFHLTGLEPRAWFTNHFWSLSVEEHFYLLLPGILVFFGKKGRVAVLSGLALAVLANRAIHIHQPSYNPFRTDVRLDSLLIPALLTVVMRASVDRYRIYGVLRYWPVIAVVLVCIFPFADDTLWGTTAIVLLMPCMIMGSILHSENVFGRLLESRILRFVGRISYSIYLWQMLFFTASYYKLAPLGALERWPFNYAITFALAIASYYCLELPMIRFGHRMAPSVTPGRLDIPDKSVA